MSSGSSKMRSTKCVAPRCGPSKNQGERAEEHSVRAAEEPWNLTDIEKTKLTELPKMNKRPTTYLLKESFAPFSIAVSRMSC
jgi:hypothetical protein